METLGKLAFTHILPYLHISLLSLMCRYGVYLGMIGLCASVDWVSVVILCNIIYRIGPSIRAIVIFRVLQLLMGGLKRAPGARPFQDWFWQKRKLKIDLESILIRYDTILCNQQHHLLRVVMHLQFFFILDFFLLD